ncbi:hypothetical protein J6590_052803, partial [Homalodisca vitripennis]
MPVVDTARSRAGMYSTLAAQDYPSLPPTLKHLNCKWCGSSFLTFSEIYSLTSVSISSPFPFHFKVSLSIQSWVRRAHYVVVCPSPPPYSDDTKTCRCSSR